MISIDSLQKQLEVHKECLKGVDDSIKKLTGRDLTKILSTDNSVNSIKRDLSAPIINNRRSLVSSENRKIILRHDNNSNDLHKSAFKRKIENDSYTRYNLRRSKSANDDSADDDVPIKKRTLQSSVISKQKVISSKEDLIKLQNKDTGSTQRNKRIFGMILGTLQKFKNDDKERSETAQAKQRKEIEKKIEVKELEEKSKIVEEKHELLKERKKQEREIRLIEKNIQLIDELQSWEKQQNNYKHFIKTKTKPFIYYLPKKLDELSEKLLAESASEVENQIKQKKTEVEKEIELLSNKENKYDKENEKLNEEKENHQETNGTVDNDHSSTDSEMEEGHNEVNVGEADDDSKEQIEEKKPESDENKNEEISIEVDQTNNNNEKKEVEDDSQKNEEIRKEDEE